MKLQSYQTYRILFITVVLMFFLDEAFLKAAPETYDLSKAVIVVNQGNRQNMNAALFLQTEIYNRSGIKLQVSSTIPEENHPTIILGKDTDFPLPRALSVPAKAESYAIWVDSTVRKGPAVLIIGRDDRGVLFGAGKFIQQLYLSANFISIKKDISIAGVPADEIRAQQIISNTQSKDGFLNWDDSAQLKQFVRDMVIFGTNGFEPTKPQLIDNYLEDLGVDLFIKLKCQDIIDYDKKSDEELMHVFDGIEGIDHITTYGGDASGAVKPQLFFPHMERVLPLILKGLPGVKWWYSNQCLEDHAVDYRMIFQALI